MVEIININGDAGILHFDEWRGHEGVPEHTRGALLRYRDKGYDPGGFMTAVLTNDLMGAISRADRENARALIEICRWVYMRMPRASWGDDDTVDQWINAGGLQGIKSRNEKVDENHE
jgi:hypothetical protein